jgi:hypothetical protein
VSKPGRIASGVVVIATVGCEIAAVVVYRNSTDGQTPILWVFIVLFGLLALGVVRLAENPVRGFWSIIHRSRS